MIARSILTLAVSGLVFANVAQAGPIFSGPAKISNLGGTLVFDLLAGGDLDSLDDLPTNATDYNLQVISVVLWSFDPPPGANGFLDLGGTLAIAGIDTGLTFSETIDLADETGNVVFSQNNGGYGGLPFGQARRTLLDNSGKLFGGVVATPGTEDAWDNFFASGGKLTNYLFVEMTIRDTNQIPEPTAMLVWGGVGGLGLVAYRWRRRRCAA